MYIFYLIACIPLIIGSILWLMSKEVCWWEWLIGAASSFIIAGICHMVVLHSAMGDTETWSGEVMRVVFHPYWHAEWTEVETYTTTDGKGNTQTHTRVVTRHEDHPEHWVAHCHFGRRGNKFRISKGKYNEIGKEFGNEISKEKGHRPDFDHGDRYDYWIYNKTNVLVPVTMIQTFENRIKASRKEGSLFNFIEVPEGVKVFDYPQNNNPFVSDRLLGSAKGIIDIRSFDELNTRLGSRKKVNLIIVGFDKKSDSMMGQYQQAKWIGGKKNDLVICYGAGENKTARWVYVFGWTEKELVKKNLQTLFLENKIGNDLLPLIEKEVNKNYAIKDWSKFDYIKVSPPMWSYFAFFMVLCVIQGGLYTWFLLNSENKRKHGL